MKCGFGIGFGIGFGFSYVISQKYLPTWVSVFLLGLNQNGSFGCTLFRRWQEWLIIFGQKREILPIVSQWLPKYKGKQSFWNPYQNLGGPLGLFRGAFILSVCWAPFYRQQKNVLKQFLRYVSFFSLNGFHRYNMSI